MIPDAHPIQAGRTSYSNASVGAWYPSSHCMSTMAWMGTDRALQSTTWLLNERLHVLESKYLTT